MVKPLRRAAGRRRAGHATAVAARHHVRDRLQHLIYTGQIAPGARLVQRELARKFNVGQGVVREALFELRGSGVVESIDNRGLFVGRNSRRRLLASYDVRGALEGLAARLCCEHISRAQLRELEGVARRIHELSVAGKPREAAKLDRSLHLTLVRIAGNEVLAGLVNRDAFLTKVAWVGADPDVTRDEHLALLKAIGENRADDADRLAREQVRRGRKTVETQFESGERPVQWVDGDDPLEGASSNREGE